MNTSISSSQTFEYKQHLKTSVFSIVIVNLKETNKDYAMKIFPHEDGHINKCYIRESRAKTLKHPNILPVYETNSEVLLDSILCSYTIMEYAKQGDLAEMLLQNNLPNDEILARTYFHQLLSAVEYLHSNNLAHLDLKMDNVLVSDDYSLKINDFDALFDFGKEKKNYFRGTVNYRAPEIKNRTCTNYTAADVFSLGIMMFVLRYRAFPFEESEVEKEMNFESFLSKAGEFIWQFNPEYAEEQIDEDFMDLFLKMISLNPEDRPTIEEIKNNPWFNGEVYRQEEVRMKMASAKNN